MADPPSSFSRIKALVIGRTLHHYYENKDGLLRERVRRRMEATGCDEAGYLVLLQGGPGSDAEWAVLEAEITVGETFFFRYAEQFAALSHTILPTLIRDRAATRRLRIWSAGCASGAEPFSVAILLHRLLGSALADWSVSILGTDISEAALEVARTAEYGDWALRSLSDDERRRDFLPVENGRGRRWQLRPAYRAMVRFERQNLLSLLEQDGSQRPCGLDLVLCRNVLIYFHADRVQALVQRFGDSLAPDGWLLLGHAEAGSFEPDGLKPVPLDGTIAWMRDTASSPSPGPATAAALGLPDRRPVRPLFPAPARSEMGAPATDAAERATVEQVRTMADAGEPEPALALCRTALERHPVSAPLFFYAALLSRALNRDGEAEADLRRAIYLSAQFAMAHYHLGLLLADAGRIEPGRRAIADAARIARTLPEGQALECGDGMTAGRLQALARLDWLPGGAAPP